MKKMIENELEKTLQSLDGMQRAEAPSFFYTRLMGRMRAKQTQRSGVIFYRPVLSLATLLLLLVLNIGVIAHFMRSPVQSVQEQTGLQTLVSEMSRDLSTVYNDKPTQ